MATIHAKTVLEWSESAESVRVREEIPGIVDILRCLASPLESGVIWIFVGVTNDGKSGFEKKTIPRAEGMMTREEYAVLIGATEADRNAPTVLLKRCNDGGFSHAIPWMDVEGCSFDVIDTSLYMPVQYHPWHVFLQAGKLITHGIFEKTLQRGSILNRGVFHAWETTLTCLWNKKAPHTLLSFTSDAPGSPAQRSIIVEGPDGLLRDIPLSALDHKKSMLRNLMDLDHVSKEDWGGYVAGYQPPVSIKDFLHRRLSDDLPMYCIGIRHCASYRFIHKKILEAIINMASTAQEILKTEEESE